MEQIERRRTPDYVTKPEFCEAVAGINSRLDKQDTKLDTLDEIKTHINVTCNIVKWLRTFVVALLSVVVPLAALGKTMGWF